MLQRAQEFVVPAERRVTLEEIIERLRLSIERKEEEIAVLKSTLVTFEGLSKDLGPKAQGVVDEILASREGAEAAFDSALTRLGAPKRERGLLPPRDIALAARDALLAANRPMDRGELVAELEKRGIPLAGKDKNKNLGTIIWRHPELFVRVGNLGYWVKDVEIPGVYTPEA